MSAATEQQNNGDLATEKVAAVADVVDTAAAVKEDLKSKPAVVESTAADNGTLSKDNDLAGEEDEEEAAATKEPPVTKAAKRPAEGKSSETKKARKDKPADGESDEEDALDEIIEGDSEIESDEYDIPYDGEEDDIECEDDDDENDDGSGSDDQA